MKINIKFFNDDFIEAIGAGIYEIGIEYNNIYKTLYIGESVFVIVRCASHLYEFKKKPDYLGFETDVINNTNIKLQFKLLKSEADMLLRKQEEKKLIKEKTPVLQSGISDRMKSIEEKVSALKAILDEMK